MQNGKIAAEPIRVEDGYVNAIDNGNNTPLNFAEIGGYTETAEILRAAGGKRFSEL